MTLRSLANFLLGSVLGAASLASAQPPPAVTLISFSDESVLSPDQMFTPTAPTLPDAVVNAINGGGFELHQQVTYDAVKSTLSIFGFLTPSNSPVPTIDMSYAAPVYSFQIAVTQMTATQTAVTFSGPVTAAGENGLTVDAGSSLATVAAAFSLQSPNAAGVARASFHSTSVAITGVGSLSATTGSGSIKILENGANLPIAVAGPKGQQFLTPSFQLTGAASKDPAGGSLTYRWVFLPTGAQSVTLVNDNTVTPTVTINDAVNGQGDYKFQLLITNANGASAIDTVTVTYALPDPQSN